MTYYTSCTFLMLVSQQHFNRTWYAASATGVLPTLSRVSIFAPDVTRYWMHSKLLQLTAWNNGVMPWLFLPSRRSTTQINQIKFNLMLGEFKGTFMPHWYLHLVEEYINYNQLWLPQQFKHKICNIIYTWNPDESSSSITCSFFRGSKLKQLVNWPISFAISFFNSFKSPFNTSWWINITLPAVVVCISGSQMEPPSQIKSTNKSSTVLTSVQQCLNNTCTL